LQTNPAVGAAPESIRVAQGDGGVERQADPAQQQDVDDRAAEVGAPPVPRPRVQHSGAARRGGHDRIGVGVDRGRLPEAHAATSLHAGFRALDLPLRGRGVQALHGAHRAPEGRAHSHAVGVAIDEWMLRCRLTCWCHTQAE